MKEANHKKIGQRLKLLREVNNKTKDDVAAILSVSKRTYEYYESGTVRISIDVALQLSAFYKVSVDFIVGESMDITPTSETLANAAQNAIFYLSFFTKKS